MGIYDEEATKLAAVRTTGNSAYGSITDCLVSGYIQEFILPLEVEEEVKFDPLDETQVDLSGLVKKK